MANTFKAPCHTMDNICSSLPIVPALRPARCLGDRCICCVSHEGYGEVNGNYGRMHSLWNSRRYIHIRLFSSSIVVLPRFRQQMKLDSWFLHLIQRISLSLLYFPRALGRAFCWRCCTQSVAAHNSWTVISLSKLKSYRIAREIVDWQQKDKQLRIRRLQ